MRLLGPSVALGVALFGGIALAQEPKAPHPGEIDYVKTVAAATLIPEKCPQHISSWSPVLNKVWRLIRDTYAKFGKEELGENIFTEALRREMLRRDDEISSAGGIESWCKYKKADYDANGLGYMFDPNNLPPRN